MRRMLPAMVVALWIATGPVWAGPFGRNLVQDGGAEIDVDGLPTTPFDGINTTRVSPNWQLAPELEARGFALSSRGTAPQSGSSFTIPYFGRGHFVVINQANPDPRARSVAGLGAMHQDFDLLALGFCEKELQASDVVVTFGGWFAGSGDRSDTVGLILQGRSDDANFNVIENRQDDLASVALSEWCGQAWTAGGVAGSDANVGQWWGITNEGFGRPALLRTTLNDDRNELLDRFRGGPSPEIVVVPAGDRVAATGVDPGFLLRTVQSRDDAEVVSEFDAIGLACGSVMAVLDVTEARSVINLHDTGPNGLFDNDDIFPGPPQLRTDGADDFMIVVEGWLDLPSGPLLLGVNSDEGFSLVVGRQTVASTPGQNRAATTTQGVEVEQAGLYPFRLTWYERTGGAEVELFESFAGDTSLAAAVLVNDVENLTQVLAFQTAEDGDGQPVFPADHLPPLCPPVPPPNTSFVGGAWAVDSRGSMGLPGAGMDEQLITPPVDLRGYVRSRLRVHSGYKAHPNQIADIDVSTDGGSTWQQVWRRHDAADAFGTDAAARAEFDERLDLDVSAIADGAPDVRVRFRFHGLGGPGGDQAVNTFFWVVDDVTISAIPDGGERIDLFSESFAAPDSPLGWQVIDGGDDADPRGHLATWYYTSIDIERGREPVRIARRFSVEEQLIDDQCSADGSELIAAPVVTEVDGIPVRSSWTFDDGASRTVRNDQPFVLRPGAGVRLETPASRASGRGLRHLRLTVFGAGVAGANVNGFVDGIYLRLDVVPQGDPPTLLQIVGGLGGVNPDTGLADTFVSPRSDQVGFDTFTMDVSDDAELAGAVEVVWTGSPESAPTVVDFARLGAGRHAVGLDGPLAPGAWAKLTLPVRSLDTGTEATLMLWIAHLPNDVNQDGVTNIRDASEFGAVFRGARQPELIDLNGDGTVNIRDASEFGTSWNGGPGRMAWRNARLPAKP